MIRQEMRFWKNKSLTNTYNSQASQCIDKIVFLYGSISKKINKLILPGVQKFRYIHQTLIPYSVCSIEKNPLEYCDHHSSS